MNQTSSEIKRTIIEEPKSLEADQLPHFEISLIDSTSGGVVQEKVKIPNKREPDNKFVMCSSTTETFLMKKNEEVNLNKTSLLLRERKRSRRNGALNRQTEFFSEN
ncbi:hypothetical protein SNEBB_003891 [Seison nebaliae]|nr:hypothetical protein SNEBB_003891 [Seison nebaliae]